MKPIFLLLMILTFPSISAEDLTTIDGKIYKDMQFEKTMSEGPAFKQNGKSKSVTVSGNLKTNNPRVVLQAALDGLGIVRLPGSYVFSHIKDGTLVGLLEDYSEGKKDIWAVTPARNKQNLNVSTFINELKVFLSEGYSDVLF